MHGFTRFTTHWSRVAVMAAMVLPWISLRAADEQVPGATVLVHVTIPPTPSPSAESDVGDRFVDLVADTFRRAGFTGKVKRLDNLDKAPADATIVRVILHEWDRDRMGNTTCRFSATLETGSAKQELGSFHGTAPGVITAPGRFGASRAFDDAADQAASELYDALAKTELIVGLRRR
jgi:hypothetical protein